MHRLRAQGYVEDAMTVSNTISTTTIDVAALIETAYRRCRVRPEQITADMLESAKSALHIALSAMPHKGFQLWTLERLTLPLVQGQEAYALDAGTIDVKDALLSIAGREHELVRVSSDHYITITDKAQQGRPNEYWVDLQRDVPVLRLWPAPDAPHAGATLVIWRKRHIMDVGSYTATLDIPQGWHDAVIADLAQRLAVETPEVDPNLAGALKMMKDEAFLLAQRHNTDSAPMRIKMRRR
jgi:hypothetical protein